MWESSFSRTARAMGSIMSTVAVLEIHMLHRAVASMNPSTIRRWLWPPTSRSIR